MQNFVLETGVDKLISLVNQRGQIELEEAANELEVSINVIKDWVRFLEDEKVIKFNYNLTKTMIVRHELSDSETKNFIITKDAFTRKAEGSLNFLKKREELIRQAKVEFENLKNELGSELNIIKEELSEIQKYEEEKKQAMQQAELQRKEAQNEIKNLNQEILNQNRKYDKLLNDIHKEINALTKETGQTSSIESNIGNLNKKLVESRNVIDIIEKNILEKNESINKTKSNIEVLKQMANELMQLMQKEKVLSLNSLENAKVQEISKIEMQEVIINQISKNQNNLISKDVQKRIDKIMNRKLRFVNLLENIDKDMEELKKEYGNLIRNANSIKPDAKDHNIRGEVDDLKEKFNTSVEKKNVFDNKFKRLFSFL